MINTDAPGSILIGANGVVGVNTSTNPQKLNASVKQKQKHLTQQVTNKSVYQTELD